MKPRRKFQLTLGRSNKGVPRPPRAGRPIPKESRVKLPVKAGVVARALMATSGATPIVKRVPNLGVASAWVPVASFAVCGKTGTAAYLDIWDSDHFDFVTDMQRCLNRCLAWFSADGYTFWGSAETKTGRINCYFRAPQDGTYVCNAQLQSDGGPAMVECLIDSFNFGPLPFNGAIIQPHPCTLNAGYHSFRIRQLSGAFFFLSLTVWST